MYNDNTQTKSMSQTQIKKIKINNLASEMKYKGVLIEQISLFKHPLIYLDLLLKVFIDTLKSIKDLFVTRFFIILFVIVLWILLSTVQSLYSVKAFVLFAVYWIVLGVASSIGLGTGLHTFVLYLGPHIAKVAIIASSCGHVPQMIPSRWEFDHFGSCNTENTTQKISFFGILLAVQLQSFFWGLGTALGELPPYFAAYKASKTKYELSKMQQIGQRKSRKIKADDQKAPLVEEKDQESPANSSESIHPPKISQQELQNEQINEIEHLKKKPNLTLIEKAKILIFENMEKYGFITILLCASIPNPLFDLAGITCGHFRIPFKKFFIPTFIGKAIIKVHIQMFFVITICRKQALDILMGWIASVSQSLSQSLLKGFEKQKQAFYHPKDVDVQSKPIVGMIWDLFLTVMIGYFLFSIVSGLIQEKAIQIRDSQHGDESKKGSNHK